jgi:hypothetical protein
MSTSLNVGRIGALAATLGVGVALFSGPGTAWADSSAADTSAADTHGATAADPGAGSQPAGTEPPARGRLDKNVRGSGTASQSAPQPSSATGRSHFDVPAAEKDLPEPVRRHGTPGRGGDFAESTAPSPAAAGSVPGPRAAGNAAADPGTSPASVPDPTPAAMAAAAVPAPAAAVTVPAAPLAVTALLESARTAVASSQAATAQAVRPGVGVPTMVAAVTNRISTLINSVVGRLVNTFFGNSPFTPQVDGPASWLLLAAARRQPLAAATGAAQVSIQVAPTLLVLDGYNVVPKTIETVTAFTGRFTYWPGMPNMFQGSQEFNLVDPATKQTVGSFEALVTAGDPASIGSRYVQLLVTGNDGNNVGTGAGQIPPVGSMISSLSLGLFGLSYSAMPSPSGDKVSVKLETPFGNIALPISYDASEGLADGTFDNRPVELGGGFSIAPAQPSGQDITASIGFLPLFNSVQGRQTFGIFDSAGKSVGSFEGEFTTTSDIISIYTQAILVTANDGVNVGTQPGQTPPVGTVYNVAYFGSDDVYLLYASMPQKPRDVISITLKTPLGVWDLPPELFNSFNASTEPTIKSLTAPGGQKFVATSAQLPAGVNGLPPRDVQTQGYQQFDVYDFLGRKIGSVDANVASQWDGYGVHSKALLITDVTAGKTGSTPFDIPPVGSVLNFIFFTGGFGLADADIPLGGVELKALNIVTPLGVIPLLPLAVPAGSRPPVEYFNPFLV